MAMRNPYARFNQYKQNNIMQASPEELTLMLYNGAIKFINQGILFIEQKNIEKTHNAIMRANAIINELNATLDMKYEVAKGFRPLYDYISDRLVDGNISKNVDALKEALELVTELRDTWKEAMVIAKKK
ncbi:flagellar export chaperone FliS [Anaeromicrobium sediminis]|uniref:Flagellar secretion chaperone FliS n=1 Tax=Anaeromicrobium sediminis TaxID=1478221 RepID=A0A267MIJ7_9FIRM|nr:flagellar export chaperone FliS [Anaeromicrobium sediminis]PAB59356.1 flagellar export chaperone FliS [Anaeromicrobium sediminis]